MTQNVISPRDYVDEALAIMQDNALCAANIADWKKYRQMILARVVGAKTIPDTYPIIREALKDLKDNHSFFVTPENHKQTYQNPDPPLPSSQKLGEVGYLKIPHYSITERLGYASFVDCIQTLIAQLDTYKPSGWVVDLRDNCGGDMWPMVAGLGPLLGEGVLGSFYYSKGPNQGHITWSYRNGGSMWNDQYICAHGDLSPYRLTNPDVPVAILVSERTASSGEAVLISFIGRLNTFSFGSATAGLSTANTPFDLADGARILLTSGVFADRYGRPYGESIVPDEVVVGDNTSKTDVVLERACCWLRQAQASVPMAPR